MIEWLYEKAPATTANRAGAADWLGVDVDDATPERWRPVPGYEGLYEVSDLGNVRSVDHTSIRGFRQGRVRKLQLDRDSWVIGLKKGDSRKVLPVRKLVAVAFLGPCPEGHEVRHLDGNRLNTVLANLAYRPLSETIPAVEDSERWLPVPDWEGLYEASDLGRIRRIVARGRWGYYGKVTILKQCIGQQGYQTVGLWRDGKSQTNMVHRLVARTFLGPRPDGLEIRHLNDNKLDNRAVNLVYGTHRENMLDTVESGNHNRASLDHCAICGEPYDEANTYRAPSRPNVRLCRNCMRRRARENKRRKKAGLPPLKPWQVKKRAA